MFSSRMNHKAITLKSGFLSAYAFFSPEIGACRVKLQSSTIAKPDLLVIFLDESFESLGQVVVAYEWGRWRRKRPGRYPRWPLLNRLPCRLHRVVFYPCCLQRRHQLFVFLLRNASFRIRLDGLLQRKYRRVSGAFSGIQREARNVGRGGFWRGNRGTWGRQRDLVAMDYRRGVLVELVSMDTVERFDLYRIAAGLRRWPSLTLLLLLLLLLPVGQFPNDKDHEVDGDEEVRRREPGAEGLPETRKGGVQGSRGGGDGGSGCGAERDDAEEAKWDFDGPNRGITCVVPQSPLGIHHRSVCVIQS